MCHEKQRQLLIKSSAVRWSCLHTVYVAAFSHTSAGVAQCSGVAVLTVCALFVYDTHPQWAMLHAMPSRSRTHVFVIRLREGTTPSVARHMVAMCEF
jgi:hypothetical protein